MMIDSMGKKIKKILPVLAILLVAGLILSRVYAPEMSQVPKLRISAKEAMNHIGKNAEVCGEIASTAFIEDVRGRPAFLNFERPHPNQVFTVVIRGENRSSWRNPPEILYEGRFVCVTGQIRMHEGIPQIIVRSPANITIQ